MFLKFLAEYADEALGVAKALTGLLDGVAINGKAAADIQATIARLEKAHDSIASYLKSKPTENTIIKISASDIDKAVKKYLENKK